MSATGARPAPPIADVEVVRCQESDGHPGGLKELERDPIRIKFRHEEVLSFGGMLAYIAGASADMEREYEIRLRYRRAVKGEDITAESWIWHPHRFEFLRDRTAAGRFVRIYAVFLPRARPRRIEERSTDPVSPSSSEPTPTALDFAIPWWSVTRWNAAPLWAERSPGEDFPGASSTWVFDTKATPPWLSAHTRPPLSAVWPPSSPRPQDPGSKFPFFGLPLELRERVYEPLLDLTALSSLVQRTDWPPDRFLRRTPAILLVCAKVADEARRVLYRQTLALQHGLRLTRSHIVRDISHLICPPLFCKLISIDLQFSGYDPDRPASDRELRNFLSMVRGILEMQIYARTSGRAMIAGDKPELVPSSRSLKVRFDMPDAHAHMVSWEVLRIAWDVADRSTQLLRLAAAEPLEIHVGSRVWEWSTLIDPEEIE